MKGDAERCLAAGMDAYLAKPLQAAELVAVLLRLAPDTVIDGARLLERVGGDRRALAEVARIFLADAPRRMGEIRRAIAKGDARALRAAAHTLKGAVSNFGADGAVEAAFELQKIGERAELEEAPAALERLEAELKVVRRELRRTLLSGSEPAKRPRPAKRARKPARAKKAGAAGRKRR
jgi:HPt (histidine-containing phosphotransfer) domain-containing protein